MSILKTTLKVESADSTSKINILTSNNVDLTSGVVHRKIKLNAGNQKAISKPDDRKGARGNFLYVKSSDSNPKHTSIQIENKQTGRLITLYAGEYGLIPLSNQELTEEELRATVTHGTAELEYFFGSRGEEIGENVLVCYESSGSWLISTLDVSTGIPNNIQNTGLEVKRYPNVSFIGAVDRTGYTIQFSTGLTPGTTMCINRNGRIVWNTNVTNYNFYGGSGKANLITWNENNVENAIYFDGDRVYQHQFPGAKNIYVEANWDERTNDGSFPVYVSGYQGKEVDALFLVRGTNSKLIKTFSNISGYRTSVFAYSNGNFVALENWEGEGRTLESLEIFNSKGTLLKRVTLNMKEPKTYYQFYGTGKLQIAYEQGESIKPIPGEKIAPRFTFLNYNQLTGKLIGEDLKWTSNYNTIDIVCDTYPVGRSSDADYKPESVAIVIYDDNEYNGDNFLNQGTGSYLEVTYIINNDTKQRNYVIPFTGDRVEKVTFYYPEGYLHAGINDFVLLNAQNTTSGPLIATRFTSGAEPTRFNLLDDISKYYYNGLDNDNWIDTQCFGDYRYLDIPTLVNIPDAEETVPGDRNIIVYDSKVLDKTVVGFNADYSTSGEFNSLLLLDWDTETASCFNTSTKKWVQPKLSGVVYDYWTAYNEGDQYPVGLSKQLLVSENWTPTLTTLYVTPITKGIAGKEKEIIKLDTTNEFGKPWWDISMSTETIVFSYKYNEKDTLKVRVYDLNFNFLYEIDTKFQNIDSTKVAGRINHYELRTGDLFTFYNFNKLLNKQSIEIPGGKYFSTTNNFSFYARK